MTDADKAQLAASDPAVSAFVSASAGTGKTKLLTDRLLRLMLAGSPPGRILCLTYTKAAAAEMAIRLNHRLGQWVVAPEPELDAALRALAIAPNADSRARARKLFAEVLDLPGGMRIETIHAFCQSLLRRFPLEAGLSPHFELADDADAAPLLREAREAVLAEPGHRQAILALAAATDESAFAALTETLAGGRHDMRALLEGGVEAAVAMQKGALAAGEHAHDEVLRDAVAWAREPHVERVLRRVAEAGTKTGQEFALDNLAWLAHEAENRVLKWVDWVGGHFTEKGARRKLENLTGRKLAAERDELHAEIEAEHERIEQIENKRKAALLCELNTNMLRLVAPILGADRAARQLAARLSYGDLITLTSRLLVKPGAAWILYKLDGGIDHLLLDEVQDTAPAQWEIAHALAAEFFAGAGSREAPRSIFAVGDEKQSIFSFQGADLESFRTYQAKFRALARGAGQGWLDGALSTSFRSTGPVLALVDEVFAGGPARLGVCAGDELLTHKASRLGQAGAVTLWPLAQAETLPPPPDWAVPDSYGSAKSATMLLAEAIAEHIGAALRDGAVLPSRGRRMNAGDFLILVRRRNVLGAAIMSACKARNIPIAGLDRMVLPEQPAVADLLALCDALLLPDDDLAFGQYLASPLGGLSDEALMDLALGRPQGWRGSLAAALSARRAEWPAAFGFFDALRGRVDFLSPHALLAEALGPLGGRARLLARFGPEAAEPIDELLAEALAFARRAPAALQSFVHHLRQAGASIKREAEASGDMVRIMTVHGAKGLQAPVVILPDTTAVPKHHETLFWLPVPQQPEVLAPVFCPRGEMRCDEVSKANTARQAAEQAETNRLLYVALTRAEDELIVCGAAPKTKLPDDCWYKYVEAGFQRLGAAADDDGRMTIAVPQSAAPDRTSKRDMAAPAPLPGWAGGAPDWAAAAPAVETARPEPLSPSRGTEPEAAKAGAASPLGGDFAQARAARAAALAKGQAVHALLQHLPDIAPSQRRQAGLRFLKSAGLAPAARTAVLDAVLQILDAPALAALFGPGSRAEAPLAGVINGVEMAGLVDRLGVGPAEILLADYKTDRAPPADAAAIPAAYARQLAAYRAILGQIFPGRPITCLLIYTETAAVLTVPPGLLDSHAPRAAAA